MYVLNGLYMIYHLDSKTTLFEKGLTKIYFLLSYCDLLLVTM